MRRTGQLIRSALLLAVAACTAPAAFSQVASGGHFDLTGPKIDVHVQRGDRSLPIALVPNLMPGDKLTIHADLPGSQSVKLIMVVAFLRGSTNPPPENWFTRINTWDKKVKSEGAVVTVPKEAQQALIFLAPETGGDYSTLKSAVTGRPGVFVRAAQDLNEASFEQARIERYLQLIRNVPSGSPEELADHSKKLAATLNLKPNDACFKQPPEQQLSCLRQSGTQLLLDDGHGQTLASMLSSGDSATLIGAVAGAPSLNSNGLSYSAYVGTVIDLVHLMAGLRSAQFQYIPAIAFPDDESLNLRLNTPPSFHNPKSVIVVALPAIQPSVPPKLRLQDPSHVACLLQPSMVLPLEGAPLVFATGFAHDLVLHLNGGTIDGKTDLPLSPDAFDGGLVLRDKPERKPLPVAAPEARDSADNPTGMPAAVANRTANTSAAKPDTADVKHASSTADGGDAIQITGTLRGEWGFDSFEGVTVPLQRRPGTAWTAAQSSELIAGKSNQLSLRSEGTACASKIELDLPGKVNLPLQWKQEEIPTSGPKSKVTILNVKLPLEQAAPGSVRLLVHQYGTDEVDKVGVTAYSDATRLTALHIHAGDNFGTLIGSGLGEVRTVRLAGREYAPSDEQPDNGKELRLVTSIAASPSGPPAKSDSKAKQPLTTPGETGMAEAILTDGRRLPVSYTVEAARPAVQLLSTSTKTDQVPSAPSSILSNLTSKGDLPLNAKITFALKSEFPSRFPRTEKVEIALADGTLHTTLTVGDGSIVLQDQKTALAFFSPAKSFGASAFGPLQLRAVADDGTVGDWIPLGTLVRTPTITGVTCNRSASKSTSSSSRVVTTPSDDSETATPAAAETGCSLAGSDLFLLDSISADSSFETAAPVPLGFAGESLPVPRPTDNHTLYLKLRDDPNAVFTVTVTPPPSVGPASHHAPAAVPAASGAAATTPAPTEPGVVASTPPAR